MPTAYRVEISNTNRAVCRNKECKDAAVKILKGELRFGVLVEIQEHQSWHWRHWGCITPQVLGNINDFINGDMEMFDGFDELPEAEQKKVTRALDQGHVDDEDWKGDVEKNRPGAKGFRLTKKEKAAKEHVEEDAGEEPDGGPPKRKTKRKAKVTADSESEPEAPPPKKKRGAVKKEEQSDNEVVPAPAAKKARAKKVKQEDTKEEEEKEAKAALPTKKTRAKKVKSEDADNGAADVNPSANRSSGKKTKKEEEDDVDMKEAVPAKKSRSKQSSRLDGEIDKRDSNAKDLAQSGSKPAKSRKKVPAAAVDEADDEEAIKSTKATKAKATKSAARTSKKIKRQDEDEDDELPNANAQAPDSPSEFEPTEPPVKKRARGRKKASGGGS